MTGTDSSQPFDILVIGGGIVGAGVARDAAMRGLRVMLVDANDFAFGTSSRSSRLLHGGLRYLAQGHLKLVREASVEKRILHTIAPHLAQPLGFVFPTRSGTPWKRWKLSIGVKLYDLLCGGKNLGKSSTLDVDDTLHAVQSLSQVNLTGAVQYFDAFTNDARLVIDTLRSAHQHGAVLQNYCSFESANRTDDAHRCTLKDTQTNELREVVSRAVVNAAGPWAQNLSHGSLQLRLTKGVHLVIDRQRLPIFDAVVMADGHRILFALPWGERTILGTTDTDYDGDPASPLCGAQDVRYILKIANESFPTAAITVEDIISTWTGVRPLIADKHGRPSDISRRHVIDSPQPGWFNVAGGKLTTYRLMAEQTIDAACKYLGRYPLSSTTMQKPLLNGGSDRFSSIVPIAPSTESVQHFCRNEWAKHLADVMIRRTSWRYYLRDHLQIAQQVAGWMAQSLHWPDEVMRGELDVYAQQIAREEAWRNGK